MATAVKLNVYGYNGEVIAFVDHENNWSVVAKDVPERVKQLWVKELTRAGRGRLVDRIYHTPTSSSRFAYQAINGFFAIYTRR